MALPIPESLTYELNWEGFHAGTSTLSITRDGNNGYKIESTAKSSNLISLFYKVSDTAESSTKPGSFASLTYRIITHEGTHNKHFDVFFAGSDGRKNTAFMDYTFHKERDYPTPPGIMDPLSSFFYVCTLPLTVGKPVHAVMFDDEKVWDVKVLVLGKERVKTWAGTFNTIKIEPLMKSSGVFRHSGAIYIWLTDDARHIPVMLQSNVKIGAIKAILQKASLGNTIIGQ